MQIRSNISARKKYAPLILLLIAAILFSAMPVSATEADSDIIISSVEVTQIMGKGIDLASGEYYFMNMFVAGKPTAIQIVMTDEITVDPNKMYVDIYYEGEKITSVKPSDSGKRQIISFIPSKSAVSEWKAGRYKFVANINGATKTTEAIFNASRTFAVLVIPASVRYNGKVYQAPSINANTVPLSAQPLPITESKFIRKYRTAPISFGTGDNGYDISTAEGESEFLCDIEQYRLKSASQYDVVIALVDSPLELGGSTGSATKGGYTDTRHAIVLTLANSDDLEATLLHEMGHIMGSGDEYINGSFMLNVNGAPYGISGNENGKTVSGTRSYLRNADGNDYSGILIHEVQNPYNPKSKTPMLNRSSFMGSSYKHWPTSMVWEQAYTKMVPNYKNVLPRVYTDGKIVAKRPTENDLSTAELDGLKEKFRQMLNEVRKASGLPLYSGKEILQSGDKHLQEAAEEAIAKGRVGQETDIESVINALRADTKYLFRSAQVSAAVHEYESNELEDMRDFFTLSPCGQSSIKEDYMFLAFVRVDNVVYYMRATASGGYPNPNQEEFESQPSVPPVLEINPVNDEPIDDGDYYLPAPYSGGAIDTPETSGTNGTSGGNKKKNSADVNTGGQNDENSKYTSLSLDERVELLNFCGFDYISAAGGMFGEEKSGSYMSDFYVWYINDRYDLNINSDDLSQATSDLQAQSWEEYDGAGNTQFAEELVYNGLCRYYELYPTQEMRENSWWYRSVFEEYGDNPRQSKYDTDEIKYYFQDESYDYDYGGDGDMSDPDGNW